MSKKLLNVKKLNTLMLSALLLSQQTLLPALASNITGIDPINNNTYNINPSKVNGDVGFRHYTNFELDKGDIANLIFKSGATNIEQFVNLVDNKIQINGILNTMRDSAFYNGHAVFVSPNGMVVGASGVLNVGSLTAIAPTTNNYLNYVRTSFDFDTAKNAAISLGGTADDVSINATNITLAELMKGDMGGDITVNGKILARGDVNLFAKNIAVAGDKSANEGNQQAAIIAGIPATYDEIISTNERAGAIFNKLVGTDVQNGTGFARDEKGNIVIQAQAIKDAGDGAATVNVSDAKIVGKNIDINAISTSQTSSTTFEYIPLFGEESDSDDNVEAALKNLASIEQDSESESDDEFKFKGARAVASVTIDSGSELIADENISIRALAEAETKAKGYEVISYYNYGVQTAANAVIKNGATLTAGKDINVDALTRNIFDVVIDGKGSEIVDGAVNVLGKNIPNIQVEILKTNVIAKTNAEVEQGAVLTAGNDVNVEALNVTDSSARVESEAWVKSSTDGQEQSSAAITLNFTNTQIDTTASVGGEVYAKDLLVSAQSVNTASNAVSSYSGVRTLPSLGYTIKNRFEKVIFGNISDNVSGLTDAIDSYLSSFNSKLPSASVALVVNNSNINTKAQVANTAKISVSNDLNIVANTIDKTVNAADSSCRMPVGADGSTGENAQYKVAPGVAVIVTNQTNNTTAIIEDGTVDNHAVISAGGTITVNATTEVPRNDAPEQLILGFKNLVLDTIDAFKNKDSVNEAFLEFRENLDDISSSFDNMGGINTLGLQGIFNNWAAAGSYNAGGTGIAASVVASTLENATTAKIGNYTVITPSENSSSAPDVKVNAANSVTQYNAAGDIVKFWQLPTSAGSKYGMGGEVIVQNVTNDAQAIIGNNADITAKDINLNSATDQDYLTMSVIYGISGGDGGLSIDGSVVVQDFQGTTESAIGASTINANNLNIKAGEADIQLAPTAKEDIAGSENSDLDGSMSADKDTGILQGDAILTTLTESKPIQDSISNLVISGAVARQKDKNPSEGQTSSSGVAVGASVNVGIIERTVRAAIADDADITLSDSLAVDAKTSSEALYLAIAGAQAGGVKTEDWISKSGAALEGAANKIKGKIQGAFDGLAGALLQDNQITNTGSLDENGNPIVKMNGKKYSTNSNGEYVDADGKNLTDASGNNVKAQSLQQNSNGSTKTPELDNQNTTNAKNTMSAALAGALNIQLNDSTVESTVGKANIKVGKSVEVTAEQSTQALNIGASAATAETVGAGAAVNVIKNSNITSATVDGAKITYTGTGTGDASNKLNVKAVENNDNIQVAVGMGMAKDKSQNNTSEGSSENSSTTVAVGGSFNTDYLTNSVSAEVKNATIKNENSTDNIQINVAADNYSTSYKGAGGMAMSRNQENGTGVGAGVAGNLNVIKKQTTARIEKSEILNASQIEVVANKDAGEDKKTENLISVGLSAAAVTGGKSGYTFEGTMGTDCIDNTIIAEVTGGTINTSGNIDVAAYNNISNWNAAGALGVSTASNGAGAGVGAIVNIFDNDVIARIANAKIEKANDVNVKALNNENLDFLAVNFGVQTQSGNAVGVNGIVNVVKNTMNASVIDSTITNSGALNVISDYDTNINGVTAVGQISNEGAAVGANVVVNTLLSENIANIEGSTVTSNGDLTLSANSNENITLTPATIAASISGNFAAAANIEVNTVSNTTKAYIDKAVKNDKDILSTISAKSIRVTASDITQTRSRGGVLAAGLDGNAIGGSISSDVFLKNVEAYIDNAVITNGGDVSVEATAQNIFGAENPSSITISGVTDQLTAGNDVSGIHYFDKWDMTYDVSGSSQASVAGSLISKVVANDVNSYIGSNTEIQEAGKIGISASNETSSAAIIGNIAGSSGSAAVGASIFSNVNASNVSAGINNGAKIGTLSNVGDISINAKSSQEYHSINFAVAGSTGAAVNGSIISNIVVNETNAYIDKNVTINSSGALTVNANDSMEVEQVQCAVAGASSAAVGAIVDVNILSNNVNSVIGRNDDSDTSKSGSLNFGGNVSTTAQSSEDVEINVIMVAGSGDASVSGVAISNTLASGANSGIEETTLVSGGTINVAAKNSYNEKNKDKTNGLGNLINKTQNGSNDSKNTIAPSDLTPIVSVLNIAGSGTAAVGGTVVNNNVITGVNSYIRNAEVEGNKINLDSDSIMTTYDAVMGIAGSSTAAVATTGVVNTYAGTTNAEISGSTISGNTYLNADDTFNLNSVIFSAAGTGTGAAITAVVDVNTISNNVLAQIIDSTITADTVEIKSTNTINISDIIAAGQGTGTGAAVGVVPITNVFNGTTSAGISKTTIDGAKLTVEASDDVNIANIVLGVSGAGVGASVGGYVLTNVFNNTLNAYISDSIIKNGQSTSVNAQADFDMVGILMSGGFTGSGAAVCLNGLTNVVNNTINSYIANSSISGGSVSVTSSQNSDIYSTTGGIAGNGTGNATVVNAITNVITNNLNAYIYNTSTDGTSTITVSTTSNEDFENINMGVSISGTASNSANTLVNVLENNSHAYIDAKSKTMNTTGKITVKSEDTIQLRNTIGLIAASVTEAAGANVNVNIINNAVKAEILSATGGQITANGVDVGANSIIAMKDTVVTGAVGVSGAGIAGTVIVNSIGDRYTNSSDELKNAGIDKALTNAKANYDGTAGKSGNAPELVLGTSSKQEGTVANISANITSSDEINVTAENVVKGYDSDTLKITNATVSGGVVGAGVGILVTDMDYNTRATISGGKVKTTSGDINVNASNSVKAQTDAVEAAFGVVAIGGNVAYFNNSANTVAQIDSAAVNSVNNLNVIATSVDDIVSNAISAKISGVSVAVSVAVAQTSNLTQALISGTNVDIDAKDINIKAGNTSSLTSKMYCASIGSSVTASALVNKAQSSSVTSALISATSGTVDAAGALNITSETGGISVKNNVVLGSAGFTSLSANTQFANAAATFNSGIQKGTTVKANSVKIKSGTKTDTDNAGVISAVVDAIEVNISAASIGATYLDARANAVSNAYGQGTVTSSTGIDIISAINRTATVESKEYSVSGLKLGGLGIVTTVGGSTNIDTSGGNLTAQGGNINLNATSVNNSKANSSKVEVALGKTGVYILQATTSSGSTVNLGNMTASGDIKAEINNTLNANLGSSSKGVSLINVGSMTMTAETSGESAIKGSGTATANNVTYTVNSTANADAKMESGSIELVGGNGTTIDVNAGSNAKITSGSIKATNVKLEANATRKATITDKQKSLSLGGLKITNLNTTASGTTGVTTSGTIQNKAGNGNATTVEISSTDKSSAENDSATSSLSFVEGSSLNITSKVNSLISNTIGGTIKGNTVSIKSTLDRSTVANATSSSAGLVDIGVMNLTSQIDNGATTTLSGTINSNNLTVNSNMNNHVETYVKDFSAGLVALAYGEAKNTVNSTAKNIINYNGTISTGSISSTIDTVSQAELFKESKNYGIFVIKGGKLTNALNAGSEMNFNNSNITTTGDASFSVKNSAQTPQEMQVTDDSGGFIVSSGANLNNNISIGSSMNFNASSNSDTLIESAGALDLNISSGTSGFKQYVVSKGSGFSANNKAASAVAATINNAVNLNSGKVIAKNLNVNLDSSNTLSSRAEVEARHFAGSPSVSSTVALTINNTVNVGGELYAQSNSGNTDDTNVNINFMHNSVQDITQYANLYAEAAVASGSASGGITFNTNNKVNVESGGAINSQKDINIIFDKGTENLKSTIEYDKISRILFGIKIHDSDTYDNITNTSKNEAIIDGTLTSGKDSSMSMVINKNGEASESYLKEGTHYTKVESSATGSDKDAVDAEVNRLTIEIGNLKDERQVLIEEQKVTLEEYNNLIEKIDSLALQLAVIKVAETLEADAKISQTEFSNVILGILKENNVKDAENYVSQLLDFISLPSSDDKNTFFYATEQNGSGIISFVADDESKYKQDSYGNYLLDGYSYQYDDNGRLKTDSNGNILVADANGNEVILYSFTMEDYINATIEFENSTSDTPQNELISALQKIKSNIKSTEIEVKVGETTQSVKMLTYNDKVIYDDSKSETAQAIQTLLDASSDNLEIVKANLTELADNITDLNESIAADNELIADIQENGLAMNVQNGTYYFNPINATSGTITIKSNKGSSKVSGSGVIQMAIADILINNYSNYNLVFSDLTIGGGNGSLNIDNKPVNINPYNGITIKTTGSENNLGGITINNWYDHNDPANNSVSGVLPSNITFNGKVTTKDGNVTIYNESGDVNINNVIDAQKVTITVPQGSLTQNTYGKTYTLAAGDTLFAGKDINITASNFIIEGTMQAGVANKNITITEDMIKNAIPETYLKEKVGSDGNVVVDADGNVVYDEVSTGRLLLNLSYGRSASEGTKLSDYMYDTNNIKAVWDPDKNTIELFGVQVTDSAGIYLTSSGYNTDASDVSASNAAIYIADTATLKYANGYGTIKIDNKTNHNLKVNAVENNYITGDITYTYKGNSTLKASENNLPKLGSYTENTYINFLGLKLPIWSTEKYYGVSSKAKLTNTAAYNPKTGKITIDTSNSTGNLDIQGLISSGNLTADKSGLELKALGNINILKRELSAESTSQAPTIQTLGDIVISNTQNSTGSININGLIENDGNITVTNNGSGDININQTGSIKNKNGEVKLTNNNSGGITTSAGSLIQNNSNISITNNGSSGMSLAGAINATTGNVDITNNSGNLDILSTANIDLNKGYLTNENYINIKNTQDAGAMTIAGTIANNGIKDINITNDSAELLLIDSFADVTAANGDINITNTNTAKDSGTTIKGSITDKNGNINITNDGAMGTTISGAITDEKGDIELVNNNGKLQTSEKSVITNNDGNTKITSNGADGAELKGKITNKGNVEITNTQNSGNMLVAGTITNNGNTNITNDGGKTTISAIINNKGITNIVNNAKGVEISGTINNTGTTNVTNSESATGEALISGTINNDGLTNVVNNSEAGTTISGTVSNKNGNIEIESTAGQFKLTDSGVIENNRGNENQAKDEDIKITNSGSGLLSFLGQIFNRKGKTEITNTNEESGIELGVTVAEDSSEVTHRGSITNESGSLAISNNGGIQGIKILGDVVSNGSTTIDNTASGIYIATVVTNNNTVNKGTITTTGGLNLTNSGAGGINAAGDVVNTNGDLIVDNKTGGVVVGRTYTPDGSFVNGKIENSSDETGKLLIQNSGDEGILVNGDVVNSKNGDLIIENNNMSNSAIITTAESLISQNIGTLNIINDGAVGIELAGAIENTKGVTNITNNSVSGGIKLAASGTVTNGDGNVNVSNIGTNGIDIEGIINVENQDIVITNKDSNIEIGEYDSDNDYYLSTANGNIIINQINGSVVNGITDIDNASNQNQDLANLDKAYKTLINTSNDLIVNIDGGNFGSDNNALSGKESGFGVNASTRDYTDSINVNVGNTITANASNNGEALINVRAKESDLNINTITSDGNVMITAADWKQADSTTPSGEDYYNGYSVLNASADSSIPNITARNISVISSNNIGSENSRLTYNQLTDGTVSMMAENNIYAEGLADKDNVWQLIAKQGNADVIFNGNAEIREVTTGNDLNLISKGSELTIYDIGKTPNLADSDDILFPHDNLLLSTGVIPDTINLAALNINENTKQENGGTISIYNALVEGTSGTKTDVTLIGDNIIANAYDAPSSPVSTPANPNGYDATANRTYSNDFTDSNSENNLKATGFTTSGQGSALVFDIQGVSPAIVAEIGANIADRTYNSQDPITAEEIFTNPNGFVDTVYKANNVTLSLNSSDKATDENRGLLINTIYADNAYVDTKDLNLNVTDAFITDYAEFRNGNLGGSPNAPIIGEDYRYSVVVDNTTSRNVGANYNIPVSAQLYTSKTGSFALSLGNSIAIKTKAPVVLYNPHLVINSPNTENSFYRLTYKEDKIQNTTTLKSFRDDDKDTYKPIKREFIRFNMENSGELISIAEHNVSSKNSRVISAIDISRGGILVNHDGSLKEHETLVIDLTCYGINVKPEVEVVYISENKAGLKFINLDASTANKILYINMTIANINTDVQVSKL